MPSADDLAVAAPVAERLAGTYGSFPPSVQITLAVCALLFALVRWGIPPLVPLLRPLAAPPPSSPSSPPAEGGADADDIVRVVVAMAEEFGRQVAHMAQTVEALQHTVEKMSAVIDGCKTCPHLPKPERIKPHAG